MPEEYVIDHCSPTLAGLKTANMFPVTLSPGEDIVSEVRTLNRLLGEKGIRTVILRRSAGKALLYLYRPDYLDRDLAVPRGEGDPGGKGVLLQRHGKLHRAAHPAYGQGRAVSA